MNKKNNNKKFSIAIGTILVLSLIPPSLSYAENINITPKKEIEVKKLSSINNEGTMAIKDDKINKNINKISIEDANRISKKLLEKYFKVDIKNNNDVKTEVKNLNGEIVYETKISSDDNGYVVIISETGEIKEAERNKYTKTQSLNHEINVDDSRKLVNEFINEYHSNREKNINVTLENSNKSANTLKFKLNRAFNNIDVLEEGGYILIDARENKIIEYKFKWSNISFEEPLNGDFSKKDAIEILNNSKELNPKFIKENEVYNIKFNIENNKEYVIDVKGKSLKDFLNSEYAPMENIKKSNSKDYGEKIKLEEIDKVSNEIINLLVEGNISSQNKKDIQENNKKILRNEIKMDNGSKYCIEFDSNTNKILSIYKKGYEALSKDKFTPIEFKEAYKNSINAINKVFSNKIENINLNHREIELSQNKVYTFNFNRTYKGIEVADQYISINIDATSGEFLSMFVDWDDDSQFNEKNLGQIERKKNEYIKKLNGNSLYINENGIGKLYYIMKN